MSKGIVMVDIPETCQDCLFSKNHPVPLQDRKYCTVLTQGVICSHQTKRPEWCPIKELPIRLEEINCPHSMSDYLRKGFSRGWNACLDEIEGN